MFEVERYGSMMHKKMKKHHIKIRIKLYYDINYINYNSIDIFIIYYWYDSCILFYYDMIILQLKLYFG